MLQKSLYMIAISALLCSQCTSNTPTTSQDIKQTPTTRVPTPSPVFTAPIPAVVPTQTNTTVPTDTQIISPTYSPTEPPLAPLKPGQVINVNSLDMKDKTNGWAIEFNGHIVHTTDGGYTWQDVTPPTEVNQSFSESGFFALDAQTAWATPGEFVNCYLRPCDKTSIDTVLVWRTNNGGKDWQASQPIPVSIDNLGAVVPIQNYFPIRIQFIDLQIGWLMIDGGIRVENNKPETTGTILLRTTDAGQHWIVINDHNHDFKFPSGEIPASPATLGFVFIDSQTGWAVGQNQYAGIKYVPVENIISSGALTLKRTSDGGYSFVDVPLWFPVDLNQPKYKGLTIGCETGQIAGITPDSIALEWSCTINSMSYYLFTMINKDGQPKPHLYSTGNEFFLNEKEGWRQSCIYVGTLCPLEYTSDGGVAWTTIKKVNWSAWQFDFVDSKSGWAIVFANDASGTKGLVRTSNGGETWVEIKPKVANQ